MSMNVSRYAGFLIICTFLRMSLAGQSPTKIDKERVFNSANLVHKKISLSSKNQPRIDFPNLEKITVIDFRSDSSCIGIRTRSSEKKNDLMNFTLGLKKEFEGFINKIGKFSGHQDHYSGLMVVRDFWMSEFEVDADESDKTLDKRVGGYAMRKTTLRVTIDYYLTRNEEFYVAYRFDTIANSFLNMKEFSEEYLSSIVRSSLSRLKEINPDSHVANKRKFNHEQLIAYYDQRWNKPILKDTVYVRGVYKSFSEFVNNRPSIAEFVVRKDKLADIIYVPNERKELSPARDVWGYSDGKNLFIKSGENYFYLVKVQHAFYFLGSKELMLSQDENYYYDPISGMRSPSTSPAYLTNRLFPMKLDMEKGAAY